LGADDLNYLMAVMGPDGQPNTLEQFTANLNLGAPVEGSEGEIVETEAGTYKHDPGDEPHRKAPQKIIVPAKVAGSFEDHANTILGNFGIGA